MADKLFVRTGLNDVRIRIHNAWVAGVQNPGQPERAQIALAPLHAPDRDAFLRHYRFRHAHGSCRAGLTPQRHRREAVSLRQPLPRIKARGGTPGLASFHDAV